MRQTSGVSPRLPVPRPTLRGVPLLLSPPHPASPVQRPLTPEATPGKALRDSCCHPCKFLPSIISSKAPSPRLPCTPSSYLLTLPVSSPGLPPVSSYVCLYCLPSPLLITNRCLLIRVCRAPLETKLREARDLVLSPASSLVARVEPGGQQGCLLQNEAAEVPSVTGVSQSRV